MDTKSEGKVPSLRGPMRVGDMSRPRLPQRRPVFAKCSQGEAVLPDEGGDHKASGQKGPIFSKQVQSDRERYWRQAASQQKEGVEETRTLSSTSLPRAVSAASHMPDTTVPASVNSHTEGCESSSAVRPLRQPYQISPIRSPPPTALHHLPPLPDTSSDEGDSDSCQGEQPSHPAPPRESTGQAVTSASREYRKGMVSRGRGGVEERDRCGVSAVSEDRGRRETAPALQGSDSESGSAASHSHSYTQSSLSSSNTSLDHTSSTRQHAKALNYMKLLLPGENGGQDYTLTLVSSQMINLVDIFSLLSISKSAKIVHSGTSPEALVEELGTQLGVPVTMDKLHTLPLCGRYSAQQLLQLSTQPLSRRTPPGWPDIVSRCQQPRARIDFILIKEEHVKYFDPCDHQTSLAEREQTFRRRTREHRLSSEEDDTTNTSCSSLELSLNSPHNTSAQYKERLPREGSVYRRLPREGSMDRRLPREGSMDRRQAREESMDRRLPREGSIDGHLSREGSVDWRLPREGSMDRRLPREGSMDWQGSMDRRLPREGSMDWRLPREGSMNWRLPREGSMDRRQPRERMLSGDGEERAGRLPQRHRGFGRWEDRKERWSKDSLLPREGSVDRHLPREGSVDRHIPRERMLSGDGKERVGTLHRGFERWDDRRERWSNDSYSSLLASQGNVGGERLKTTLNTK